MEMVSSTSHSPHISFGHISVGFKQGPWHPEVPSSPTACGACRQALAWSRSSHIVGSQGFGLPRWNVELSRGADPVLQILPAPESQVPYPPASCTLHLPGTGTAVTGPALDVSHPSINRLCSPAL